VFFLAPARHRRRLVRDALTDCAWVKDIRGALTVQVPLDYAMLWERLDQAVLQSRVHDRLIWRWSANKQYSVSLAYRVMLVGSIRMAGTKELWKVCTPPKGKYFFWLALHSQHWTANRRWRHNLQDSDSCALCHQVSETGTPADGLCSHTGVWSFA
jgi:hypothetical protein